AQPLGPRNSETLLSTSERFFGQPIPHGLLEQPFPLSVSQLEATGQPAAELDEVIVQKNGSRLQRHHHAGAIDLGQNVIGKVEIRVELQSLVEQIATAFSPHVERLWIYFLRRQRCLENLANDVRVGWTQPNGIPIGLRPGQSRKAATQHEVEAHIARRNRQEIGQLSQAPMQSLRYQPSINLSG